MGVHNTKQNTSSCTEPSCGPQLPSLLKVILDSYFKQYASGIVLLGIHVSSPIIPDHLQQQFEALDEERTKVLIAQERLKVQELELEMLKRKALAEVSW